MYCDWFITGLEGRTSLDRAKVDVISETMRQSIQPITEIFNEVDDNKKVSNSDKLPNDNNVITTLVRTSSLY